MIKQNKGYTLGVLVITIAVMLILTTTALLSFKNMSGDKEITNFMNDIQEVEEYVREYYATKRMLPVQYDESHNPLKITETEYEKVRSQVSDGDFGSYYFVDLTKLERIHLKDFSRKYIVNENSLRVYVLNPIVYQDITYYAVTDDMKGYDKTYNESTNFEILISGNPIAWTNKAKLILSIPNEEEIASDWTFKYYVGGSITGEEFKTQGKLFLYGETIEIDQNGIVCFYVENSEGYAKTINVVVSKIDDIPPTILISGDKINNGEIVLLDNETGINPDKLIYKIIGYDDLADSEGGRTLLSYGINYSRYIEAYELLKDRQANLETQISDGIALGKTEIELDVYRVELGNVNAEINTLNATNREFNDGTSPYDDTEANIALYVQDYGENKSDYKTGISRKVLLNSKLVNYEAKLLDNSGFSVVKTAPYVSGDFVKLRIRSQGATHMLITMDSTISPQNLTNYAEYQSSNGEYEFDVSMAEGKDTIIYAYYTAGEYKDGNLVYKSFEDKISIDRTLSTIAAPTVKINNKLEVEVTVNQKDTGSGIFNVEYGFQEADATEDLNLYSWCSTVSELENALKPAKMYYMRTRVKDNAGNGPAVSNYVQVQCPTIKIVATPNRPKLVDMKAITWKSNLEEVEIDEYSLKDTSGTTRVWYDYKMQTEVDEAETKWANAKSTDGSYWVWIPRYAYRIIYYTSASKTEVKGYYQNSAYSNSIGYYRADGKTVAQESDIKTLYGEIDVIFLYNTEDSKYYDTETKLVKSLIEGGDRQYSEYIVHPAFKPYTVGSTVNSLGKWNRELTGIWVAKFEASNSDATFTSQGSSNIIKVVPNVKTLTNVLINDAYNYCAQLKTAMYSHLMKNSEWGATAYLAYSAYGRNGGKVKPNLSSNMITGGGASSNGATYATTSETLFGSRYGYKTNSGMLASTTKNIYGIYDLVGGAWEYTSSYVNNGSIALSTNGLSLQNVSTIHFAQSYNGGADNTNSSNYNANLGVYGDGIYELSTSATSMWDNNIIEYPASEKPFFIKGGSYETNYDRIGIFTITGSNGASSDTVGFRPVLAP